MKFKFVYYLIFFLLGFFVLLSFFYLKNKKNVKEFMPIESSFTLNPPELALQGKLELVKGTANKQAREEKDPVEITSEDELLQGESIILNKDSVADLIFTDFLKATLYDGSQLTAVNLITDNFLLEQQDGEISYQSLSDSPLSLRVADVLLNLKQKANLSVTLKNQQINLRLTSGAVEFALVDLENNTHLYKMSATNSALIDNKRKTVEIKEL